MSKKKLKQADSIILLLVVLIFIIRAVFNCELVWVGAIVSLIILFRYLPVMSSAYKLPAWIFTVVGLFSMLYCKEDLLHMSQGIGTMLSTVAIVTVMQTLSIAFACGEYGNHISKFVGKYSKNEGNLYIIVEVFSHLLCSILNLGEVVIVLNSITEEVRSNVKNYSRFIATSISAGHCTAFLWAPGSITVLLTLQIFELDWLEYVGPGVLIAFIGIVVSGISEHRKLKKNIIQCSCEELNKTDNVKLGIIVLIIFLIIANMLLLKTLFRNSGGTEILVLDVAIVSAIWSLFQKDKNRLKEEISKFTSETLPQMGGLCAFFLSMGIFSSGIQIIGINRLLAKLTGIVANMPGIIILAVVPMLIIFFSLIGIHPMVSLAVLGPIISNFAGSVSAMQLALTAAMGCCLSYMISPFAGLILFLSQQLDISAKRIALKYNLPHAVIYFFIGLGTIYFIF